MVDRCPYEVSLLRGFEVRCNGSPVALSLSTQRVVAYVAIHDRVVGRAQVAGALWPETTDSRAAANLRTALWRLRNGGINIIDITPSQLRIADGVRVDVTSLDAAGRSLRNDRWREELSEIDPDDFRGELLPGFWDVWLVVERERLRQVSLQVLEWLAGELSMHGLHTKAVLAALAAVEVEPLRESANRALVLAHAAMGNRSEAVAAYRRFCALLNLEMQLAPTFDVRDLLQEPLTVG